ncbi:hypothetical protein JAAARDRAFT_591782 [Jaapia argillacea MUCL 33604]|uniref:Uncharacterized protein n=1 Tax=Jaapia argillacea MUCL 33604 TaxID=933084 RepID=A0A067PZ65_9AGAM|nr:hypothetical protein JAAARDRAFT_591782 [Jaapia argillacea MUCL 33604]
MMYPNDNTVNRRNHSSENSKLTSSKGSDEGPFPTIGDEDLASPNSSPPISPPLPRPLPLNTFSYSAHFLKNRSKASGELYLIVGRSKSRALAGERVRVNAGEVEVGNRRGNGGRDGLVEVVVRANRLWRRASLSVALVVANGFLADLLVPANGLLPLPVNSKEFFDTFLTNGLPSPNSDGGV